MEECVAIISQQPKLASQEDITDDVICAVPKSSVYDDPVFEPLKTVTNVQIRQVLFASDIDDANDVVDSKYEIRNAAKTLQFVASKRTSGVMSTSKCHDGQLGCTILVETVQGQPVIEMEGVAGYTGLAQMKITRAEEALGEVIQILDWCSTCNPDYIVRNNEGVDLLRICVLDGGFFCGIFGVRKFMIISGDSQTVLGEIVNETTRINSRRKLVADEQRPLKKIRIAMSDDLDLQAKALIIAAAFTVNFHDTVFRFNKHQEHLEGNSQDEHQTEQQEFQPVEAASVCSGERALMHVIH